MQKKSTDLINKAIISIGSNIEPQKNIRQALDLLSAESNLVSVSSIIRTEPIGYTDQPDFLNASAMVKTDLSFDSFTGYLKKLERRLGRIKTENKFGPRNIDLDIVIWNGKIVDNDFYRRSFLKRTILEIMPDLEM